jgi:copper oxidase (laccase) domain-containing protein
LAEGESSRGEPADGLVAGEDGPSLAMFAADCALVAMASREGPRGVVHVGWRGLRAGIVAEAASLLREMGAGEIAALRGPCIGPECYEFGPAELDELARLFGDSVRSETAGGRPSLDLPAGVRCALAAAGVDLVSEFDSCTACGRFADGTSAWFSHRARGDSGRHAMVVGSVISHEGTARPD